MSRFHRQASELTRLMLTQLFLNACVAGMRMTMSLRLAQGEEAVGCLIALFALSQVFLALPAGRYCERHGVKRPILRSIAVAVCGCALAAAWPIFPVLCVSAVLTGGAGGVAIIAVQRHTPRIASGPAALQNAFSWLAIGLALSNVLGPLVAGVVIDSAGFRAITCPWHRRRLFNRVVSRTSGGTSRCGGSSWLRGCWHRAGTCTPS